MERESAQQIAQRLNQAFLKGVGVTTQLPGPAAPSVRKYYSYHPGYDIGTKAGTPVYAPSAGQVKNLGLQGGYGQRAAYYDPRTKQTYLLSHLQKIAQEGVVKPGQVIGYTGGVPGTYGAGQTTGPHIDIEIMGGQPTFTNALRKIGAESRQSFAAPKTARRRVDLSELLAKAQKQYGKGVKAVGSRKFVEKAAKKFGGKIVKINV